jgi:hypothetical protein
MENVIGDQEGGFEGSSLGAFGVLELGAGGWRFGRLYFA